MFLQRKKIQKQSFQQQNGEPNGHLSNTQPDKNFFLAQLPFPVSVGLPYSNYTREPANNTSVIRKPYVTRALNSRKITNTETDTRYSNKARPDE